MAKERTKENARILLVRQLQDAMFELSFDPDGSDEANLELFEKLALVADGIVELTGAEIGSIDDDGNAHVKFVFSHLWDNEDFADILA